MDVPHRLSLTEGAQFDDFEVNFRTGELRRRGVFIPVQGKPLAVLATLLQRPNELISREELHRALWPGETFVDYDKNLGVAVAKLRVILGDSAGAPRYIETIPRRGYRFIGELKPFHTVSAEPPVAEQAMAQPDETGHMPVAEVHPALQVDQPSVPHPVGSREGPKAQWRWPSFRFWGVALAVPVLLSALYFFPRLKAIVIALTSRQLNPEARQDYLKAKDFSDRWILDDVKSAIIFDNRAIALEPTYAPAFSLRSSLLFRLGDMGAMDDVEACRRARADAQRAIYLDPDLASGYVALANIQMMHDWDLAGAQTSLDKAHRIAPNELSTLTALASLSRASGRLEESISLQRQVIALDPFKGSQYGSLAVRLYAVGKLDDALAAHQRALELDPQLEYIHLNRAEILLAKGLPTEALLEVEAEPGEVWRMLGKVLVLHDLGRETESDAALKQLMATHSAEPYIISCAFAYRGEVDEALTWLGRAFERHDVSPSEMRSDPLLRKLYPEPRFEALRRRMGISH